MDSISINKKYLGIIKHYESCLEKYGDTVKGVDWPNVADALKRHEVMLDLIKFTPHKILEKNRIISLLDFGCGTSQLLDYINEYNLNDIEYSGLDLSPKFIELSKAKYPANSYYQIDILESPNQVPTFDYIILNGVFTEKQELNFEEMFSYFKEILRILYQHLSKGLAFNVMSKQVDWEREDLFHLPMDTLANFLVEEFGRNFVIRNDYQLYEYTTYIYKNS